MKSWLSGILGDVLLWLLRRYRELSMDLLKLHAVMWYVRGVSALRKVVVSVIFLVLCLMLAGGGFILLHLGLYKLLPPPANAIVLLSLGAIYLILALLSLGWVCSEKTWMKGSNAAALTEFVTKKKDGC